MSELLPVRYQEHCQLTALGINLTDISFSTLTMESEKFICVREQASDKRSVAILDLSDPTQLLRRPITADSAIMHPSAKVIALRAERNIQIFNLELKQKIKGHVMHEDIVFWKWISLNVLGLVTDLSVYHWQMDGDSSPVKIFDRHTSLINTQIINYRTNSDSSWMVLVGISSKEGRVAGNMQLFSREKNVSQPLEGHAAVFAELKMDGWMCKLFAFAVRTATGAKMHIIEIDHQPQNPAFPKLALPLHFPPDAQADFPVALHCTPTSFLFLFTKFGYLHLYDLESGKCVFVNRVSGETVFVSVGSGEGVLGVNRKGY